MNNYDKGQKVRVRGTWSNKQGVTIDPDSGYMTFQFRAGPTGAVTTYTWPTSGQIVRESVGVFYVDLLADIDDVDYYYRWASIGSIQAAKEGSFHVNESNLD